LTVRETIAVLLVFIFELQITEILEFFMGGVPPTDKPGKSQCGILLLHNKTASAD
jgi:hypothetical protein